MLYEEHNNLAPAEVFPPGEFLRDELEARGWSQQDFSDITEIPASTISQIINAKRIITPEIAKIIGMALGTSAELWHGLEGAYQLAMAKNGPNSVSERSRLYAVAPVGEMVRRGWIDQTNDVSQMESRLKKFFGTDDLSNIKDLATAARKSSSYDETGTPERAWNYRVLRMAKAVQAAEFDPDVFAKELPKFRAFTMFPDNLRKLPELLAKFGIRLVLVSHLERTKLDGSTLWLDDHRKHPVVGLTMRYDRLDWFWFTLMHELVHVKYRECSTDSDMMADAKGEGGSGLLNPSNEQEKRANSEAAAILVPQDKLDSFVMRTKPLYSRDKIMRFAQLHGVHPGIVLGQLHHRKEVPSKNLRDLLLQNGVRSIIAGQALTDGWGHQPGSF